MDESGDEAEGVEADTKMTLQGGVSEDYYLLWDTIILSSIKVLANKLVKDKSFLICRVCTLVKQP